MPGNINSLWLALVTGTPTGTTPTLAVFLDAVDAFGNVLPAAVTLPAGFSLTTVAGAGQCSIGFMAPSPLQLVLPYAVQLRWTVSGTTPNYPNVQLTLLGR